MASGASAAESLMGGRMLNAMRSTSLWRNDRRVD